MSGRVSMPMSAAREIYERVSKVMGVSVEALTSESHATKVARARYMVMRLMRDRSATLQAIGRLTQRHHSTVLHGLSEYERLLDEDAEFALAAAQLKQWSNAA
jgi:chromosomal replication initiation ATPase DnaA